MPKYRHDLPQLAESVFLTDGGIETSLIYHEGMELPDFAAFVLLADEVGTDALRRYFEPYLAIAREARVGVVLETPTWRASSDWGRRLGYGPESLAAANAAAIDQLVELRDVWATPSTPIVISGCIGPRGDGYQPDSLMTPEQAADYHAEQVDSFRATEADLVTAITMTHSGEATGFVRAARAAGLPSVVSFTVETDGRLPSGERLAEAIAVVDGATDGAPAYYMVNCAHPTHVEGTLRGLGRLAERVRGLRANASTMSHAELDEAETLDIGDPVDLADRYADLRRDLPALTVLGGCCGTDARHVEAIAKACVG